MSNQFAVTVRPGESVNDALARIEAQADVAVNRAHDSRCPMCICSPCRCGELDRDYERSAHPWR